MSLEVGDIVIRGDIRGRKRYRISHFDDSGWVYARPVDGGDLVTFLPEHRLKKVESVARPARGSTSPRQAFFDADQKEVYRTLQDARAYVTDFDRDGRKAGALYERLARAGRLMRPWSTDGTAEQSKKAVEYLQEITSILSEKIGPASRREFPEQQGGSEPSRSEMEQDIARLGSDPGPGASDIEDLMATMRAHPTDEDLKLKDRRSGNYVHLTVRGGRVVGAMGSEPKRFLGLTVDQARHVARGGRSGGR